jgi:hypothetical protein
MQYEQHRKGEEKKDLTETLASTALKRYRRRLQQEGVKVRTDTYHSSNRAVMRRLDNDVRIVHDYKKTELGVRLDSLYIIGPDVTDDLDVIIHDPPENCEKIILGARKNKYDDKDVEELIERIDRTCTEVAANVTEKCLDKAVLARIRKKETKPPEDPHDYDLDTSAFEQMEQEESIDAGDGVQIDVGEAMQEPEWEFVDSVERYLEDREQKKEEKQ